MTNTGSGADDTIKTTITITNLSELLMGVTCLELIEDHHIHGILVLVTEDKDVVDVFVEIKRALSSAGLTSDLDYEIQCLHAKSSEVAKASAASKPTCRSKILVSSNIIDSEIPLPWVTGIVTDVKTIKQINQQTRYLETHTSQNAQLFYSLKKRNPSQRRAPKNTSSRNKRVGSFGDILQDAFNHGS